MGSHNGSKKRRSVPLVDTKVHQKTADVVQLHPLAQFRQQERLVPFAQLRVGDQFKLPRTESSPKEGECPTFTKTELIRKDIDNPVSDLFNCKVGSWTGWLPGMIQVIPIF